MQTLSVTVVFVDIVESVSLMQHEFEDVVVRWQELVRRVRAMLPELRGRLVKSLGDGLLLTFEATPEALRCAFAVQDAIEDLNRSAPPERAIQLRVAVHRADVLVDDLDIYGPGVNLAARLLTLARPGQVVVSDEARDELDDPFAVAFDDLGPCYLKHLDEPVRAFIARLPTSPDRRPACRPPGTDTLRPRIAVLTFREDRGVEAGWGALLADELTRLLTQQSLCAVVSRLSTALLSSDGDSLALQAERLQATYLVAGHCRAAGGRVDVHTVLWLQGAGAITMHDFNLSFDELRDPDANRINRWVSEISQALLGVELRRASGLALPSLADFTLLFAGVAMMHKTSGVMVQRAGETLEQLVDRHPRAAEPRAWLAKWHVLRMANGLVTDGPAEGRRARAHIERALGEQPQHALAHTVGGLVHLFLERDIDTARRCYQTALAINPNESLAWLFLSSVHAHAGDGGQAMSCIDHARALSPVDPLTHFFDGFTAWSLLAAGRYNEAETYARRALAANRMHRPSYFTLVMAQQLSGRSVEARETAQAVLALVPNFSVAGYLKGFPGGANEHAEQLGRALRNAGLPA